MSMSAAQRKRLERERKRDELRVMPDDSYPYLSEPFFKWLQRTEGHGDWSSAQFHFDAAAMPLPEMEDDSGPKSIDGEIELTKDDDYDPYPGYAGSIGRVEALLDHLVAGLSNIALVVNTYKKEEISKRIKDLELEDLPDPVARRRAFDEMARLQKMLAQLNKMKRINFYEWSLKGG